MKFYDLSFLLYVVIILCTGGAITAINYFYDEFWEDDNPFEEYVEKKIEQNTGLDIDLTPSTPE